MLDIRYTYSNFPLSPFKSKHDRETQISSSSVDLWQLYGKYLCSSSPDQKTKHTRMDCIKKLKSRCKNCRCSVLSPSDARYYWGWGLIILVLVEVIPPSREWRRHLSETLTLPWAGRAVAGWVAPDCLVTAFLGSISAQLRGIARSSLARGETLRYTTSVTELQGQHCICISAKSDVNTSCENPLRNWW